MNREDILAQANAALRLGDWFVPPEGARILLPDREDWLFVGVAGHLDRISAPWLMFHAKPWRPQKDKLITRYVMEKDIFQILELPEDCPPFEQWKRATNG